MKTQEQLKENAAKNRKQQLEHRKELQEWFKAFRDGMIEFAGVKR